MTERGHVSFDLPGADQEGLAAQLRRGLLQRGFGVSSGDDLGYATTLEVTLGGAGWTVLAGHVGDPGGREWLVFADAGPSRRLLRRREVSALGPVTAALHDVLVRDLGVTPQWFTQQEWDGTDGPGAAGP